MKKAALLMLAAAGILAAFLWQGRRSPPPELQGELDTAPVAEEPSLAFAEEPKPNPSTPVQAPKVGGVTSALGEWLLLMRTQGNLSEAQKAALSALELALLQAGEAAVPAILDQLAKSPHETAVYERLFNLLRQLPGPRVEAALIAEATQGSQPSTRTMAMETLGTLKTAASLRTLTQIAEHDSQLPSQPLIIAARTPENSSTELPDEQVFTPRMQAMAALANSGDPQAVDVLARVARGGPDESLRMEAARHLAAFRADPRAQDVLRVSAASDPSPYVRLSALHSLKGSEDPSMRPMLERLAVGDSDAGVRLLAREVLDQLP